MGSPTADHSHPAGSATGADDYARVQTAGGHIGQREDGLRLDPANSRRVVDRDRGGAMRYRDACLGCPLQITESAVPDLRVSSLVDSHAHDGRFGLPGHDMVFSAAPATRLRCSVDGKRARQRGRCRFKAGDIRLREALRRAAGTTGSRPSTGEAAEKSSQQAPPATVGLSIRVITAARRARARR
jgi:hypothetical protein